MSHPPAPSEPSGPPEIAALAESLRAALGRAGASVEREALDFQHIAAIYDRALLDRAAGGRLGT